MGYYNIIKEYTLEELNEICKNDAKTNFINKYCVNIKGCIYHELGHIIIFILDLNNDQDLYSIIKKLSNNFIDIEEKVCIYAYDYYKSHNDIAEILAEIFSMYMYNPNANDLVYMVGKYIEKKYNEFKNQKYVFNEKYKKHLIRAKRFSKIKQ